MQYPRGKQASNDPAPAAGEPAGNDLQPAKRRRPWRRIVAAGIAGLVVLVGLLPSVASLGPVRQIVVAEINRGQSSYAVKIDGWSIGWWTGLQISGLRISDAGDGVHLAQASSVRFSRGWVRSLWGSHNLGEVWISGLDFNLQRDGSGQAKLQDLVRELAGMHATIHLENASGTLQDDSLGTFVRIDQLDGTLLLHGRTGGIENDFVGSARWMNGAPTRWELAGQILPTDGNLNSRNAVLKERLSAMGIKADVKLSSQAGSEDWALAVTNGSIDLPTLQTIEAADEPAGRLTADNVRIEKGRATFAFCGICNSRGMDLSQPAIVQIEPLDLAVAEAQGAGSQTAHLPGATLTISENSIASQREFDGVFSTGSVGELDAVLKLPVAAEASGQFTLDGHADLQKLQGATGPLLRRMAPAGDDASTQSAWPELLPMIFQGIFQIDSGTGTISCSGNVVGNRLRLEQPLTIQWKNMTGRQPSAGGSGAAVKVADQTFRFGGEIEWTNLQLQAHLAQLADQP